MDFPPQLLDAVEATFAVHPLVPARDLIEQRLDARGRWLLAIFAPTGADFSRLIQVVEWRLITRIDDRIHDYLK